MLAYIRCQDTCIGLEGEQQWGLTYILQNYNYFFLFMCHIYNTYKQTWDIIMTKSMYHPIWGYWQIYFEIYLYVVWWLQRVSQSCMPIKDAPLEMLRARFPDQWRWAFTIYKNGQISLLNRQLSSVSANQQLAQELHQFGWWMLVVLYTMHLRYG